MEWFYAKEGKQLGPVEFSELKRMAGSGELKPDSLVWKKGMAAWTAASSVQGIFGAAATTDTGSVIAGAGFWIRLLARLIDMLYVGVLGIFAGVIGGIILVVLAGHLRAGWQARMGGFSVFGLLAAVMGTILYHGICEGLHGSTVGKLICGLRVTKEDGSRADIRSAFIRTAGFYVDGLFFGLIAYLSMRKSSLRQRYGDKWGGTMVARTADLPESARGPLGPFFLALAYGSSACAAMLALGLLIKTI